MATTAQSATPAARPDAAPASGRTVGSADLGRAVRALHEAFDLG